VSDETIPDIFTVAGDPLKPGKLFNSSWEYFNSMVAVLLGLMTDDVKRKAYKVVMDAVAKLMGFKSALHAILFTLVDYMNKFFNFGIAQETLAKLYDYLSVVLDKVNWSVDWMLTGSVVVGGENMNFLLSKVVRTFVNVALQGAEAFSNNFSMDTAISWGIQAAEQIANGILENKDALLSEISSMATYATQMSFDQVVAVGAPAALGIHFAYWAYTDPESFYNGVKNTMNTILAPYDYFMYVLNYYPDVKYKQIGDDAFKGTYESPGLTWTKEYQLSGVDGIELPPIQKDQQAALDALDKRYPERSGVFTVDEIDDVVRQIKSSDPVRMMPNVQTMTQVDPSTLLGYGIDGKKNGYISKKSVPQRTDEFRKFGNKLINIGYLDRNTVSLRSKGGWKLKNTPNKIIGGAVAGVLKAMVDNKPPSAEDVLKLTDDEKDYLNKLTASANVDGFNVPTQKKTEEEKLKHEFEKTRGIIAAGNDNPDLIKSFKRMLVQLIHNKQIPKAQASDVLMELHLLGH